MLGPDIKHPAPSIVVLSLRPYLVLYLIRAHAEALVSLVNHGVGPQRQERHSDLSRFRSRLPRSRALLVRMSRWRCPSEPGQLCPSATNYTRIARAFLFIASLWKQPACSDFILLVSALRSSVRVLNDSFLCICGH